MKKTALLFFICAMIFCQENNNFTGNLNYFYVSRLSDGSIINLPFRIADFIYQKDEGDFSVYANMAMEYRLPSENHFLVNTSSQDFTWDLRELYLTWFLPIGEIRFGKQINSWGNVDGNSPINNINANDYYYLFSIGTEQKIGSFSTAGELYINNWTFGFSFSPIHNTNRIPLNDIEFPVKMPASPRASQLLEIDNPLEFGGYLSKSFEKGDFTTSYFKGYDRSFGLSGANVYADDNFLYHKLDTVFSYRKTEVLGLGVIYFLGNLFVVIMRISILMIQMKILREVIQIELPIYLVFQLVLLKLLSLIHSMLKQNIMKSIYNLNMNYHWTLILGGNILNMIP